MKTYVAILIGIVVLFGVVFGGYNFIKTRGVEQVPETQNQLNMVAFNGDVVRLFDGEENKVNYTFDIPETASTSVEMEGAFIKIKNASVPYANIYISYEGFRGFSPLDYITEVIAPHVAVINPTGTSTIGAYEWQIAESEGSEWHVAPINDGMWLVIVENKKTVHNQVQKTLESVKLD
ncbi:MAG: hypothetical protein WCT07_02355 [Candidatus Paceibacterota bacterium]|jgi:hypothetical protein